MEIIPVRATLAQVSQCLRVYHKSTNRLDTTTLRRNIPVRELPPPTPREAYLPQRPGRTHTRGNDYKLSKLSKQSEKLSRQSKESREELEPGGPAEKEAEQGATPSH